MVKNKVKGFKVGDSVRVLNVHAHDESWVKVGEEYVIVRIDQYEEGDDFHGIFIRSSSGHATDTLAPSQLVLVKRGGVVKPVGRLEFKVLKDSCNNFEEVLRADSVVKATRLFKKTYKSRPGFTLYAPVLSSFEDVRVRFRQAKGR